MRFGLPLVLAAAALLLGCEREGATVTPEHSEDKDAFLAELEDPARDAWAKPAQVLEALSLDRADLVIADIGAGSGYFSRRLAERVPEGTVFAIDVDRDFKHHIEARKETWGTPNITPRLAMYEDPLLPERSVDLIFISNTYAYISDRARYLEAVNLALNDAGRLVVIDFRADATCNGVEGCTPPKQRLPKDDVIAEVTASGLDLERDESFLPHQYFLVFRK